MSLRHVTNLASPLTPAYLNHFNSQHPQPISLFNNLQVIWDQPKHPSSWLHSLAAETLQEKSLNPTDSYRERERQTKTIKPLHLNRKWPI